MYKTTSEFFTSGIGQCLPMDFVLKGNTEASRNKSHWFTIDSVEVM